MRIETDKVMFSGGAMFSVLPDVAVSLSKGSTTPSVTNLQVLVFTNTGATTVTNFVGGLTGQTIRCLGDGQTTVAHGSTIKTNTGANKLLAANKMYVFTHYSEVWYEDA